MMEIVLAAAFIVRALLWAMLVVFGVWGWHWVARPRASCSAFESVA